MKQTGTLLLLGILLGVASCSSATSSGNALHVVAAENLYGDIVSQLGGPLVQVTSIISDPNADPHLFEPGTATGAAVASAAVVIQSGLGYDAFMQRLLDASPNAHRIVVTIATSIGISGTDVNPHIWYDTPALPKVARAIADALERALPGGHRSEIEALVSRFDASLAPLDATVTSIKAHHAGTPVAYTEPVPGYLLAACGLHVLTPESFARAIEEGVDPSAASVAQMRALLSQQRVKVLLYNSQATSPITDQIRALARKNGIPIVPVTETMPIGQTFQSWQLAQARALESALG